MTSYFGFSMADLRDSKETHPSVQAWLAAVDDACSRGDLDGALREWTDLRKRLPDVFATYLRLVRALRQAGRDAEAEALLTDAGRLFPGELEPIFIYALMA